jgi:hypothetical protein
LVAGKALDACLAVLRQRTYHLQWYCYLYDKLQEGFVNGSEEYVHGSLLMLSEALKYTGNFMLPRFREVCRSIMSLKDHRSRMVRSKIIDLLPALAGLSADAFARSHLDESVDFLSKSAKSIELLPHVLGATGKLSIVLGPHLIPRMGQLMSIVKDSFAQMHEHTADGRGGLYTYVGNQSPCAHTIRCIGDMVEGLGPPFHTPDGVLALLDPMLQSGLSTELIDTLSIIYEHMPDQKAGIQGRLLIEATRILGMDKTHQSLMLNDASLLLPDYLYSWAREGVRTKNLSLLHLYDDDSSLIIREVEKYGGSSNLHESGPSQSYVSLVHAGKPVGASSHRGTPKLASSSSSTINLSVHSQSMHRSTSSPRGSAKGGTPNPVSLVKKRMPHFGVSGSEEFRKGGMTRQPSAAAVGSTALGWGGMGGMAFGMGMAFRWGIGAVGNTSTADYRDGSQVDDSCVHNIIKLAFRTLASLSIPALNLLTLIQHCVAPYLVSEDDSLRMDSAITCSQLLVTCIRSSEGYHKGPTVVEIDGIITQLLNVTVADTSPVVRLAVLRSFTEVFYSYLCRAHHIETMMMLLADDSLDVKMEVLVLLGSITNRNPSAVLPPIRLLLAQLISEMKTCPDTKSVEEASLMLCNFLKVPAFAPVVKPYTKTLVSSLALRSSDIRAATAALEAAGELAIVLQHSMLPFVDELLPVIIVNMLDSSSFRKQEAATKVCYAQLNLFIVIIVII